MIDHLQLIKAIQIEIPLTHRPFKTLAYKLGTTEDEVLQALAELKRKGVLRSIAGMFNATKLGYQSNLVAFCVPEEHIERAVAVINPLPGVSHNYLRDGQYNIWFTLALPNTVDFVSYVEDCARKAGATDFNIFRAVQLVKLSARFAVDDVMDEKGIAHMPNETISIDDTIKYVIRVLQQDLPLVSEPFRAIVAEKGVPVDSNEVIAIANKLLQAGVMRSYRAVVRHHALGFTENAMTVWKDDGKSSYIVQEFAKEKAISHLYVRQSFPHPWEYPIFAMVHAKTHDELNTIIQRLSSIAGTDYRNYRSLKEFKKERVRYFEE